MAIFRKAITVPPSPCLQVMTPPGSPPRESSLRSTVRSTDKDDLKQHFVDAIRQVLSETPFVPTSSPVKSQHTTASLLTDLLEVFQSTPTSAATTGNWPSASVDVKEDNRLQLPCDCRAVTPPNSPCIAPSEPAAAFRLKGPTDSLTHVPDDPRAYSVSAEKPRPSASPKSSVPLNGDDVEILQDLGPANGDQVTPNTIDTAATGEQRLVAGPHISNVEEGKTRGVCDIKESENKCSSGAFGTSMPQFTADELEKLLASAAHTRGPADSSDAADALGFYEVTEIESEGVIKLAHNVAMSDEVPLCADHIRSALRERVYYTHSWLHD